MAVSTFQAQSNLTSPCDDNFGTGTLLDFPDAQSNSSATANVNVAFQVTARERSRQLSAHRASIRSVWRGCSSRSGRALQARAASRMEHADR
jgi:hypothetical protein